MISKKDLKNYEFRSLENYFDYISESIINGQTSQAKDLFNKLNDRQKAQALKYFIGGFTNEFICENTDGQTRQDTLKFLINNEVII